MEIMRFLVHYGLHFIAPIFIGLIGYPKKWKSVTLLLWLTMLVDLDHLLAENIFDPNRCSINFHPLHTYWAILIYIIGLGWQKTRIISIGLLFHMLTDWIDCLWMG